MFQNGGIRVTKASNIFNLIRNPEATVDDLRKLLELVPAKLQEKEKRLNPLDIATNEEMIKLLTEKGLTKTDLTKKDLYEETIDFIKKSSTKREYYQLVIDFLKDKDLSTLTSNQQTEIFSKIHYEPTMIKAVLEAKLNPNTIFRDLPIIFSMYDIDNLILLLEKGANPDIEVDHITPLLESIKKNHILKMELLLKKGADPNKIVNGKTYFAYCYNYNSPLDIYETLLDNGANPDMWFDITKKIPAIAAFVINNKKEIFDLFIEKGANINFKLNTESLLIHYAATTSHGLPYIKILLEKGNDINAINKENATPLIMAVYVADKNNTINIIKYLLEKKADKTIKTYNGQTAADIARKKFDTNPEIFKEILELLGEPVKEEMWKGSTRSDIEKYDIFFEQPYDYSCCPICLEYLERKEGCMYMTHDCATTKHYYHKELYDAFAYERFEGGVKKVEWCTICGRPTKEHKHYVLSSANAPSKNMATLKPEIQARLDRGDNQAFFDNANCMGFGGGGTEEKAVRFRRLREYALELQEDVDKKSYNNAMKELIEEVFNAPLVRNRKIKKILEDKRWNINVKEFPNNPKKNNSNNNNKNYTNIPFEGSLPTKLDSKEHDCIIMADDDEGKEENPTYHFHHSRNGGLDHDGIFICQKDLSRAIEIANKEFGDVRFGKCWFSQCQGILHPEEIKNIVPDILYEDYRKKFNKKMAKNGGASRRNNKTRKMKGGNNNNKKQESVLHKLDLDNAECIPFNLTRNGKLRKN